MSGQTVTLEPGDTVIEHPGMVHVASNDGEVPIVVLLSSLIPKGDELSSPVPEAGA